jgi:hypothetical protein
MTAGSTSVASVAQRATAAIVGGYALASASGILLSWVLPMPRFEAVTVAMLLAFVVYTVAILWSFAVHSLWHMWLGLVLPTALCGAVSLLLRPAGAG